MASDRFGESFPRFVAAVIGCAFALACGCTAKTETTSPEVAWAARAEVEIRSDIHPRSPVAARVPLGGAVEVVGRRRKLLRVRAGGEIEGWAREEEFISSPVRREVERQRDRTAHLTSQGLFRAFDALNVHVEPYRWSPSVYQLQTDEGAELLRREAVRRRDADVPPEAAAGALEDWYLVRLPTAAVGWILASRVYAGIPVEVAQYAEGRRIVSYHAIDDIADRELGVSKTTWLWTQVQNDGAAADFDRFRVFRWSSRRGAYQTVKLERGIAGFLPVTIHPAEPDRRSTGPSFTILVERDGQRFARTYRLAGAQVRLLGEEPAAPAPPPTDLPPPPADLPAAPSLSDQIRDWWRRPS